MGDLFDKANNAKKIEFQPIFRDSLIAVLEKGSPAL